MANVLQSNGLVIYLYDGEGYSPFGCAKTSTITINRDTIELAPKSNLGYKSFIKSRNSFTVSGNGLITLFEPSKISISNFDLFIEGNDSANITGRFEMISMSGAYKKYSFTGILTNLTLESTIGEFATYSFTIQGTGPFVEIP